MAAAIALAVVLVVAVAGMSLAMQSQQPSGSQGRTPRVPRFPTTPGAARTPTPRTWRGRERRVNPVPAEPTEPTELVRPPDVPPKVPEILRSGVPATAKVVNVVDERVVGPVTRSRLTLRIDPEGGDSFEVNIRHAFPTADARAKVRVGGTVPVRYDKDEPRKVVLDPEADAGDPPA